MQYSQLIYVIYWAGGPYGKKTVPLVLNTALGLQNCFYGVKVCTKFEVLLQKQFLSVVTFKIIWNQTFLP